MTLTGVHKFFSSNKIDLLSLGGYLDSLESSTRISEIRSLDAKQQSALFNAAEGFRHIDFAHFVPTGTPPLTEVVHYGRNSLPFLRLFEKRFCLASAEVAQVCGYNEQPIKFLTGPGYFMMWQATEFEVAIDYTQLPLEKPRSWPAILPNSAGLGRWIYDGTLDIVRGISEHVVIGRATRAGIPLDNWFVLCRA